MRLVLKATRVRLVLKLSYQSEAGLEVELPE